MEIKIVGTGCAKCRKLEELVREVVEELQINAEIGKISEIKEIVKTGILLTPGLIIDGEVKISGKLPAKEEIAEIIQASQK
ncbi:MAG TPA: thioredoxin family protein [Clostridia bacterium]|jgi:small redox-active disulfide protein 2|nr:thioredoxin family protein [Clostridia bacterium]HHY05644.1 thioredoxin family protein [Clostridia bacterium]